MITEANARTTVVPLQVLALSDATRTYLRVLRATLPVAADMGEAGALLTDMIRDSLRPTEPGTAASVELAIRDVIEP